MTEATVVIYTDGACSGNPGVGGYGAVLLYKGHTKEISGGEAFTTNNQMELRAVIEALKALTRRGLLIEVYTDSVYVQKGITEWLSKWQANGWKNSKKEAVKNSDLWKELASLAEQHQITWNWVKGHNNDRYNERADYLARRGIEQQQYE